MCALHSCTVHTYSNCHRCTKEFALAQVVPQNRGSICHTLARSLARSLSSLSLSMSHVLALSHSLSHSLTHAITLSLTLSFTVSSLHQFPRETLSMLETSQHNLPPCDQMTSIRRDSWCSGHKPKCCAPPRIRCTARLRCLPEEFQRVCVFD